MQMKKYHFDFFNQKSRNVLACHELDVDDNAFLFSNRSIEEAGKGNWDGCVVELRDKLETALANSLAAHHRFERDPYVRRIDLTDGKTINVAVINQQSKEWYGSVNFIRTCDFLLEAQRGLFQNCRKFIDLGGHQMVWSVYYALTREDATVKSFEPSVLNAVIGLFNCLANGVIERVDVIPYAVSAETSKAESNESAKMLVDFMKIPLRTCHLSDFLIGDYDFIKTDIEGYEYELLGDEKFLQLVKNAQASHYELHLGHLIKRGVALEDCINALKRAGLDGAELHSQKNMYDFLSTCDRNGFHAFVIK